MSAAAALALVLGLMPALHALGIDAIGFPAHAVPGGVPHEVIERLGILFGPGTAIFAIVSVFFVELYGLTGGPEGLSNVPGLSIAGWKIADPRLFFVVAWLAALVALLAIRNTLESRTGRAVRALAGNELAAASLGVDVYRYKLFVFVLTSMLASLAGWLYVHFNNFCSPETFNFFASVMLLVMVALGGWGRYWGALWGALILTAVPELLRVFESLEILVFGVAMVLVLLFFPQGIDGAISKASR